MKAYVAGRTSDVGSVRRAQAICREAGYEIAFDWTGPEGEVRMDWSDARERAREISTREREACRESDLLVLIWKVVDAGGPVGALIETGMAMASNSRIIVVGPARESVFWYLPEVERVADLSELRVILEIERELTA